MGTKALSKATVTDRDINHLLHLRSVFEVQKLRMQMAEAALEEVEDSIMSRIRSGAAVVSSRQVQLKTVERRNVQWKAVAAEALGAEAVEQILATTEPTVTFRLLVKAA